MEHSKYIIVGGGMTAASAVKAIRSIDPDGKITLFSLEANPPYARPPLTKGLWLGKSFEKIWRKIDFPNIEVHLETAIIRVDIKNKAIEDSQGNQYQFDKLLLATGGRPRRLNFGGDHVIYYRTLTDYYRTRALSNTTANFCILGSGFIGSELAAALCQVGSPVTIVTPDDGLNERVLPTDLSGWLTQYFRQRGVEILTQDKTTSLELKEKKYLLATSSGKEILVDAVIAGIGIDPEVTLAESAGINVDNGILVNEYCQTSAENVYSAGDAANFYNPTLDQRLRVEHEDNSVSMGWTAGLNMAGKPEIYNHLPFFYSDMFELGYEAVGDLDPTLQVITDWVDPYKKGVLYYTREGIVRGVLLWNVWGKVDEARNLVQERKTHSALDLTGRLTS